MKIVSTTDLGNFWRNILYRSTRNQDTEEPKKSIIEDISLSKGLKSNRIFIIFRRYRKIDEK